MLGLLLIAILVGSVGLTVLIDESSRRRLSGRRRGGSRTTAWFSVVTLLLWSLLYWCATLCLWAAYDKGLLFEPAWSIVLSISSSLYYVVGLVLVMAYLLYGFSRWRVPTVRVVLSVALIAAQMGCTKAVTLTDVRYTDLDGSGQKRYRIEMRAGAVHVVKEFRPMEKQIIVTKFDKFAGSYDDDGPVPKTPYLIPTSEITRIDEIRSDGQKTAMTIVFVGGGLVLLIIAAGSAATSSWF